MLIVKGTIGDHIAATTRAAADVVEVDVVVEAVDVGRGGGLASLARRLVASPLATAHDCRGDECVQRDQTDGDHDGAVDTHRGPKRPAERLADGRHALRMLVVEHGNGQHEPHDHE